MAVISHRGTLTRIVFTLFVFLLALSAKGNSISSQQAKRIAERFLAAKRPALRSEMELQLVYTSSGVPTRGESFSDESYYIFSSVGSEGFVIVAGDDRSEAVLGYSLESRFDARDLPPNFVYWLTQIEASVESARQNPAIPRMRSVRSGQRITPLLGPLQWNQRKPYNLYSPKIHGKSTPAGCVATAIAQIMRYHSWPYRGSGSVDYVNKANGEQIKLTFGKRDYDWASMLPRYDDNSPEKSQEAVALLMQEVGAAVGMQYDTDGSSSTSQFVPAAFIDNFAYSVGIQYLLRELYTREEWEAIIVRELSQQRPLYYSGVTAEGGHAFVCDGYDGDGFFHINWGWGGLSNGYFSLLSLSPDAQGTGSFTGGGYTRWQDIIIGIEPAYNSALPLVYSLVCNGIDCAEKSNLLKSADHIFHIKALASLTVRPFTFNAGIALYDSQERLLEVFQDNTNLKIEKIYWGFYDKPRSFTVSFKKYADGEYILKPVFRPEGGLWGEVPIPKTLPSTFKVRIEGDKVHFNCDEKTVDLKAEIVTSEIFYDTPSPIEVRITNTGVSEYSSTVGIRQITNVSDGSPVLEETLVGDAVRDVALYTSLQLPPGESTVIKTHLKGQYSTAPLYLEVLCDESNMTSSPKDSTHAATQKRIALRELTIRSAVDLTGVPICELITQKDTTVENGGRLKFTVDFAAPADKGFSGNLVALIFPAEGGYNVASTPPTHQVILPGKTVRLEFTHTPNYLAGQYAAGFYYRLPSMEKYEPLVNFKGDTVYYLFAVANSLALPNFNHPDPGPVAVSTQPLADISLSQNPATTHVFISNPSGYSLLSLEILTASGQILQRMAAPLPEVIDLSSFPRGLCLLRITATEGSCVIPLIVQ